jgi:hypothetical protein
MAMSKSYLAKKLFEIEELFQRLGGVLEFQPVLE